MASTPHKRADAPKHGRHMAGGAGAATDESRAPRTYRASEQEATRGSHARSHQAISTASAAAAPTTAASARAPRAGVPRFSSTAADLTMNVPQQPSGPDATSAFVPLEADAPRPIGVDPSETGSFTRLESGEGARLTTRDNAVEAREAVTISREHAGNRRLRKSSRPQVASHQTKTKGNSKVFVGLGIAAIVVIAIGFFLLHGILNAGDTPSEGSSQLEQTQVSTDQSITYNDVTYRLAQQDDGSYALTKAHGDGDATALFTLSGTPVQLVLCNGAIIIPENLDGKWDVIAYTLSDGSVPVQVADSDGNPVGGDGSITSVVLDGTVLHVTSDVGSVDVTVG